MEMPGVTVPLLVMMTMMLVAASVAYSEVVGPEFSKDGITANDHVNGDLDRPQTKPNYRHKRSAFRWALGQIRNKAIYKMQFKNPVRSEFLIVRGVRNDAVYDFRSFQPKQTFTDPNGLAGKFDNEGASVHLTSTKGSSLPALEIRNNNGVDVSVIYCDSIDQMEKVYNFIMNHRYID